MIVSVWICDTKQCATGEWYPLPSPTFNLGEMFSTDRLGLGLGSLPLPLPLPLPQTLPLTLPLTLDLSTDRIDEIALLDSLAGQTDGCEPCAFLSGGD